MNYGLKQPTCGTCAYWAPHPHMEKEGRPYGWCFRLTFKYEPTNEVAQHSWCGQHSEFDEFLRKWRYAKEMAARQEEKEEGAK